MFQRHKIDDTINTSHNAHQEDYNDEEAEDIYDFSENEAESRDLNMNFSDIRVSLDDHRRSVVMSALDRRNSSTKRLKIVFENSYRIEPKPDQIFMSFKVKGIINALVGPLFSNFMYESKAGANLCKLICNKLVLLVKKKLDYPRYRYVCHVTMVQTMKQGIMIADRSLWFPPVDNCAVSTFVKKDVVLVVTFHAIYLE